MARIEAAATALRSFIQFKDGAVLQPLKQSTNLDFTSDEHLENGTDCREHLLGCEICSEQLVELLDKHSSHATSNNKLGMASKYSNFYFVFNTIFSIFYFLFQNILKY